MAEGTGTLTVELDFDNSGVFATDITAYLPAPQTLAISGIGRQEDLSVGGISSLTLTLENKDGHFTPKNTGGAYYNDVHPGIGIRVNFIFNSVTYARFQGIVEEIAVDGSVGGQKAVITARDMAARIDATDVRLSLQEDALTGTIIGALLDETGIPVGIMGRAVDVGDTRLERIAFDRGKALEYINRVSQEELGGLFYMDGSVATFEAKSHRWLSPHTVSQATFSERGILSYAENIRDRISEIILDFPEWDVGIPGSKVFDLFPVPRFIPPSSTLRIEAPYGGTIVSDTITPIANTDYLISTYPGGGDDRSGDVSLAFTDFGGASQAIFTNNVAVGLYLISYQVRGTPVRYASDLTPIRATPSSPPTSIPAVVRFGYEFNSSRASMQTWSEYLAARWGDVQRERLSLTLQAPWPKADITASDMVQILSRKVSDRITVVSTTLPFSVKVNADYHIDSIDLAIRDDHIEATYRLVPVDVDFFKWDISSWDGADVWAP